jgi:two-component system cell cycle response regulator
MTARVLVVDDLLPNIKLLEARLTAEYFNVLTATNGPQAIELCERGEADLVLLDVMMPGMDGFEVCRRLKNAPTTAHLPIVMVTALDQPADRLRGLDAGADDFITKPINEVALLARVKSLVRLKVLTDELRSRAMSSKDIGVPDPLAGAAAETGIDGRVLLVDDRPSSYERLIAALQQNQKVDLETNALSVPVLVGQVDYDLVIISLALQNFDGLRLCSQLRSIEKTRKLPILVIADMDDDARVMRGLEIGVNDYLVRPVDRNEMLARVRTQIRRKRFTDRLAASVQASMEMAIIDPLTGLHNRRFMQSHLSMLVGEGLNKGRALTVLVLDIDHFKAVNDTYGHDAGDEVLREFAQRMRDAVRGVDLVCRTGGEEFVVMMPDTEPEIGMKVAERLRRSIEGRLFPVHQGTRHIQVTTSVGLASLQVGDGNGDALLKKADLALYRAKKEGRNRVVAEAA